MFTNAKNKDVFLDNVFTARKVPVVTRALELARTIRDRQTMGSEEQDNIDTEADTETTSPQDKHPLTLERTETIFHCLVTGLDPSDDNYQLNKFEPPSIGHDIYFMHHYNDVLVQNPDGNIKRWEYNFFGGFDDWNRKPGRTVFTQNAYFSNDKNFLRDRAKLDSDGFRIYYIEHFLKQHPNEFEFIDEETGRKNDGGLEYLQKYRTLLEGGGDRWKAMEYECFLTDKAFERLQEYLSRKYCQFFDNKGNVHKIENVRCLPVQGKAYVRCHPLIRKNVPKVLPRFKEPILYRSALSGQNTFLERVRHLCLCDTKCIDAKKLEENGLENWEQYVTDCSLTQPSTRRKTSTPIAKTCREFIFEVAQNYKGGNPSDDIALPQFAHGGGIVLQAMSHKFAGNKSSAPDHPDDGSAGSSEVDEEQDRSTTEIMEDNDKSSHDRDEDEDDSRSNNDSTVDDFHFIDANQLPEQKPIPYQEGTKLSNFMRCLVQCHHTTEGNEDKTYSADEFENACIEYINEVKSVNRLLKKEVTGKEIDNHCMALEFLASYEGLCIGDQDRHGDNTKEQDLNIVSSQDGYKPCRAVRPNRNFQPRSFRDLIKLMDRQASLLSSGDKSSPFELPSLEALVTNIGEPDFNIEYTLKYAQTLIMPCFQRDHAVLEYQERNKVPLLSRPCCKCSHMSKCQQKCDCKKGERACTSCQSSYCRNTAENWAAINRKNEARSERDKLSKDQRSLKNTIKRILAKKVEERTPRQNRDLASCETKVKEIEESKDKLQTIIDAELPAFKQPKRRVDKTSPFQQYGSFTLDRGDMILIPGTCLHYGVRRTNMVAVSVITCPKSGNVEFSQTGAAQRGVITITDFMEKVWNLFQKNTAYHCRRLLLKWLSAYLVLGLCNQIHISFHMGFYTKFNPILRQIEDKHFVLLDHKLPGAKKQTNTRQEVPYQERLCFEPESIPDYFTSNIAQNKERKKEKPSQLEKEKHRNNFRIKLEYRQLMRAVYKTLTEDFACQKIDDLWKRS
jgi:hypothetical protein